MNYNNVPKIITGKDLDYLSDMFNWNYGLYKNTVNSINCVLDEEIANFLDKVSKIVYNNMNNVINVLNDEVNNG